MSTPILIIAAFVLDKLPDSIEQRRDLLEALLAILPTSDPMRHQVAVMLGYLDKHILMQRELPLQINPNHSKS